MENDDMFDALLYAIEQSLNRSIFRQNPTYEKLEFDCDTNLTDEDMLKLHIDIALQNRDEDMFMMLSEQLKETVT